MRDSKLDEIDLKILNLLQEDGRMSQQDLADSVGLSSPATGERVRKLVDRGVIRGFAAIVDPKKVGRDVTAFVSVGIDGSEYFSRFVEKAVEAPEVLECHAITGSGSHVLKTRTTNTSTLEQLLARIQSWPGVSWTTTNVVLSVAKETARIVMDPAEVREEER